MDSRARFAELENLAPGGVLFRVPTRRTEFSSTIPKLEIENRTSDNKKLDKIVKSLKVDFTEVSKLEDLLESRAIPCKLTVSYSASKPESLSSHKARAYPKRFEEWKDFDELAQAFESAEDLKEPMYSPEATSKAMWSGHSASSEIEEFGWLRSVLVDKLIPESSLTKPNHALPDMCLFNRNTENGEKWPGLMIEAKSTQNLLLPEAAEDIVDDYLVAEYFWVQYPLGQLACYMVNNRCQYGLLTSGTRTYFVHAKLEDGLVRFFVSRRWYVAEKNYIRAWAYIIKKAKESEPIDLLVNPDQSFHQLTGDGRNVRVSKSRPLQQHNESTNCEEEPIAKRTRSAHQEQPRTAVQSWEMDNLFGVLEESAENIIMLWNKPLGYGLNGLVHCGVWRHNRKKRIVALKQFDLNKGGGPRFEDELKAYVELKELQGIAIPRLLFVSRSWCGNVRFLGIELGRQVKGDEPRLEKHIADVHKLLENAGWRQPEEEKKNANHVWLDNRLVVIDLEMLERI